MMYDGLFCAFDQCAMGLGTERYNGADGVSRERQDAFSALSHERAAAAIKDGQFADEIVAGQRAPAQGRSRWSSTPTRACGPETTAESLGKLRPAFDKNGTITAGNASQISDGGAAVIVMSKAKAEELGRHPARRAGQLRPGGRPEPVAAPPAVPRHLGGPGQGRPDASATSTSSRSTRPSPPSACASADDLGIGERRGQRQRRRHRPRPPGRHVGHPAGPDRAARAQAPGRRHRGGQPVRWRRPGRRRRPAHRSGHRRPRSGGQ